MNTTMRASRPFFAACMIALGVTGLVNGDFALVWQPVPAGVPGRTILAYACAGVEVVLGMGLLSERTWRPACGSLFAFLVLWLVLLKIPVVIQAPAEAGSWGGVGEIAIVTSGAWSLFACGAGGTAAARWLLIAALPMIGAEVITDAAKAGDRVMQPWLQALPHPATWAVATGVGSIAACLGLLFGVWPRLAVSLQAAMLGLIAIVYWGPDLYTGRTAATAFIISLLIAAGAWAVADTYRDVPWFATGRPVWNTG